MDVPHSRRLALVPALLAAIVAATAAGLGGCGNSSSGSGSKSRPLTALGGKQIFQTAGCAGCHTLAAAGANGNVGPDLDNLKPSEAAVVAQVTDGGGGMPSFKGQLTPAEVKRVAKFVSSATR